MTFLVFQEDRIGKFYRLNDRIQSQTLRVIDPEGGQLGVISRDEAIRKAKDLGMDLVEVAPNAQPPVARIVDFSKFKYEENKKEQLAKKNAKDVELKELWFSPRIADHDLQTRLRRVDEFLGEGNKILIRIKFTGREMAHRENGYTVLNRIMAQLGNKVAFDREAKFEGRSLTAIIGKSKSQKQSEAAATTEAVV